MLIQFDLNSNDAEALLRHTLSFKPSTDDPREDARLKEALEALSEPLAEQLPWVSSKPAG
ncbi:hypothetical protein PSE10B_55950 [Pseudomonas amygdali pv. eriobotryae]|uniref:hypothetical protein n=1 Tax=Pseudomonas amygdali TaxID=47877 RepID=UPI0016762155|nr:hypothetical protein [Pseudomonas amygdali]GFZ69073.1 hypothetical protein PSE10B_55950 [Pseudomonas amygdali pv. eriobotryae]